MGLGGLWLGKVAGAGSAQALSGRPSATVWAAPACAWAAEPRASPAPYAARGRLLLSGVLGAQGPLAAAAPGPRVAVANVQVVLH